MIPSKIQQIPAGSTRKHAARTGRLPLVIAALAICLGLAAALTGSPNHRAAATTTASTAKPRVFAYYYLWWSADHWRSSLGPHYPSTANPMPLPATLAANGCNPKSKYAGNSLTDVPAHIYSQDDPGFIEADVRQAASFGLTGFIVNWIGTGSASQSVTSNPYSRRLQTLVDAVHKVNAQGIPFKLWLSYKSSASSVSQSAMDNDLKYFIAHYGSDPAFDRVQSAKPTVIWQGSRKYPLARLQHESATFRSKLRLIGDESSWSGSRAPYLDGDAYYWSSQDPWANPQSFGQLQNLANAVRASVKNLDGSRKVWVAPFAPGFDKQLAGGSACVPRNGGKTIRALFSGNATTHPDDFGLISWNEITEGSYVDPMTRYGSQDLAALKPLIS